MLNVDVIAIELHNKRKQNDKLSLITLVSNESYSKIKQR